MDMCHHLNRSSATGHWSQTAPIPIGQFWTTLLIGDTCQANQGSYDLHEFLYRPIAMIVGQLLTNTKTRLIGGWSILLLLWAYRDGFIPHGWKNIFSCNIIPCWWSKLWRKELSSSTQHVTDAELLLKVHCTRCGLAQRLILCGLIRSHVGFINFKQLVSWIVKERKQLELFTFMVWPIWHQRNEVQVRAPVTVLHQVAEVSWISLTEYHSKLLDTESQVEPRNHRLQIKWLPPPVNLVKINFNGTVFSKENKSEIGVVVRNENELVLGSCTKRLSQAYSAT